MAIKFLHDIDVDGEVQGTSLDINGAANIDGLLDVNTGSANTVAIFESTDDKAFIRIKDNDTDTHLITKDNVFSIGESSSDYDNFKVDISSGNTTVAGTFTAGGQITGTEIEGTSLDINGNGDVSGDLTVTGVIYNAGNVMVTQGGPKLILKDSTDNDDHSIVFRRNTDDDDYKIATQDFTSGGGGDGFYMGSIVGAEVAFVTNNTTALTLDTSQNATFAGDITLGANHIGRDGDNYIGFETDDLIKFRVAGATQVKVSDGVFSPQTDSDVDLGTNSVRFKDAYIDSVTATTFSGDLNGTVNTSTTATTQSAGNNSTKVATTAYVDTAVSNLVDTAPSNLNTLNELAAALGDDVNFSTTVTNSIATKLPLAGGTMTGAITMSTADDHINFDVNNAAIFDNSNNNNAWYIRNGGTNAASLQMGTGSSPGSNIKLTLDGSGNATFAETITWGGDKGILHYGSDRAILRADQVLEIQTNGTSSPTAAITLDTSQNATFAGAIAMGNNNITGINSLQANGDVTILTSTGEYSIYGAANGQTALYNNGIKTFETTTAGADITGGTLSFSTSGDITFPDNAGAALEFKEGSNLYMRFVTTNSSEKIEVNKNLTLATGSGLGFTLDGNTITGIDDSGEFTNDDAHIMTSAAIEDKILGYGYTASALPLSGGTITGTTSLNSDVPLRFGTSSTFIEGATSGSKLMLNAQTDIFLRINGSTVGQYDSTGKFTTGNMTVNGDTFTFESANADDPRFIIKNTTNDNQASRLEFQKLRADDGVAQGQNLGEIWFSGQNNDQSSEEYAYIIGEIDASGAGSESGQLVFGVAGTGGANRTGLKLTGGGSGEVDVVVGLGAASVTAVQGTLTAVGTITGSADVIAYSDKKLKENIKTLDGKKVLEMRGVSFDRVDTGKASSGVIAQEIQEVAPELVHDTDGTLGVAYGNLVGYLIEAIKDQQKQIDELKEMCSGCSK